MENYKEKYEEALERARVWKEKSGMPADRQGILDDIFPDLKESEDESIRKSLIKSYINQHPSNFPTVDGFTREQILAWLENQGEHKFPSLSEKEIVCLKRTLDFLREEHNSYTGKDFTNKIAVLEWLITHPVLVHPSELQQNQGEQKSTEWHREDEQNLNVCLGYIPDEFLRRWLKDVVHEKYDKPTWSEEDEKRIESVIEHLENSISDTPSSLRPYVRKDIDWLKSLKERYTWKPSESDILLLERIANGKSNPQDFQASLGGLIGQLRKLRKE